MNRQPKSRRDDWPAVNAVTTNNNGAPSIPLASRGQPDADRGAERPKTVRKLLLNAADAAAALSIGERTFWELVKEGKIRAVEIGRRALFRPRDLREFVAGLADRRHRSRSPRQEGAES